MPPAPRYAFLALLLLAALVAGCHSPSPDEQAAALGQEIALLHAQLPADPTAAQAAELEKPAKRAAQAYATICDLRAKHPQDICVEATLARIEPLYTEIRRTHRLGTERAGVANLLSGLKVRGYRAARTVAVPKLIVTLAAAARQAAETDPAQLPKLVRETAELAATLADIAPAATADTAPLSRADWLRAAERLEACNRAEPGEFALGLGIIYGVLGQSGFALVELERAEAARFERPELAPLVPLARAVVFSRLGCTELAAREASRLSGDTEQGRQLLAAVHAALAYAYAGEKDWKQMDRELGEAVRIWPDNPLVVYLTGERLLADGRRERALATFARASAGSEAAWLAPLLEKRIREVRDSRGEVPPLVLDHAFLAEAVLRSLVAEARQTPAGRKLAAFVGAAHLLPALGGADTTAPAAAP